MDEEKDKDEDVQSADVLERNERESEKIEAERRHWHALGVVGKAHNIVMWVRGKPQHRSVWISQHMKKLKKEMLQADNETVGIVPGTCFMSFNVRKSVLKYM